jgi:ubiquinone/menaquinone biosynthesis C-methylase UbiE
MKKSEYAQMAARESTYWWHIGRLRIVDEQLSKISSNKRLKILNIGCGTGGTVTVLERHGEVTNVDVSREAIKFLKAKGHDGILVNGAKLPFRDGQFDLVVAMDVLEHIEYDQESLAEWRRVLQDKGNVLITVPAYSWLWSGHDISLHHWRRYTKSKLVWDLKKVSMRPVKSTYAISFSLPLVAGFRMLNKLIGKEIDDESSYVDLPAPINSLFTALLTIESRWLKTFSLPAGTTVIGIFRKN